MKILHTKRHRLKFNCIILLPLILYFFHYSGTDNPGHITHAEGLDTAYSFSHNGYDYHLKLKLRDDTLTHIYSEMYKGDSLVFESRWFLPYPVYRFFIADFNNDGLQDIGVGVIKSTRFDPVVRKRPFFLQFLDGAVRPLWLGTKLGHPLENFKAIKRKGKTYLRSLEIEKDGTYLIAEYIWHGFGFKFVEYKYRHLNKKQAFQKF